MTNLSRAHKANRQSGESRYRSLLEASIDPMVIIEPGGNIMDLNLAFQDITGRLRGQLIGTAISTYFMDADQVLSVIEEIQVQDRAANLPLRIEKQDGETADVQLNGAVYRDEEGVELGCVLVIRDVTAQLKFERELIEARRTAEREKQVAEEAMKAKQQFLSNMSHEIRTPLNAIIGFTKVVLKTELNEKQKEYLTAIKISGDALIVLINDILDLAKVDAGKMTFEQIPFKLSESMTSMLHLFETKLFKKKIELIQEYDAAIPDVVVGDPVRLHQIILNLVGNAVKFTTEGKITVAAKLLQEDNNSINIRFSVTDTGIGIPENELGSIFDNFQQASTGTSRIYGGTGLGLAIVKQLVVSQGGRVDVQSVLGEGSCFSFELNFQKTLEQVHKQDDIDVRSRETLNNAKVLVVEDVALNQLLMKTLLKEYGFEYVNAANGKIAIEKLKEEHFDIILMDIQMPEMNGYEATECIRKEMKLDIPIIALTADVTTTDVAKCKAVGMNDYLSKPVDDKLLFTKITELLNFSTAQRESKVQISTDIVRYKTINLQYMRQHTHANATMMREMISTYLQETPKLLDTMHASINNMDWQSLEEAAHAILPSFTIVGIDKHYEEMVKKLKGLASRREKAALIAHLLDKVTDVCKKATDELQAELDAL